MRCGRVAGLALVVGIWTAAGVGVPGVAWADEPGAESTSQSEESADTDTPEPEDTEDTEPEDTEEAEAEAEAADVEDAESAEPEKPVAKRERPSARTSPRSVTRVTEARRAEAPAPTQQPYRAAVPTPAANESTTTAPAVAQVVPAAAVPAAAALTAPQPKWTSTLPNPVTAVRYVTSLVRSFVGAVLSPFAAGLPAGPTGPPSLWAVLAFVRREFFNSKPRIEYSGETTQTTTGLVLGNVGASDPDGDPLTYTVVGRPSNGGVVVIDQDTGNFAYRPMNAMAATGGTDTFTVVVSDERAGTHWHGPLGFLQHVPIIGHLLNPGGGHAVAKTITVNVTPVEGIDLSFPDDFHWGVAHAGFQAEGGPGSPVDPNSDWYKWVHHPLNQLLGLTNGVPENGPGTYVSYESDAELARNELGMNTFRMSIEWSTDLPEFDRGHRHHRRGRRRQPGRPAGTQRTGQPGGGGALPRGLRRAARARAGTAGDRQPLHAADLDPRPGDRPPADPAGPAGATGRLAVRRDPGGIREIRGVPGLHLRRPGGQLGDPQRAVPPIMTEFLSIPGLVPTWPPGVIRPDLAIRFLVNEAKGHVAAYDAIHKYDTDAFVGFANNMVPARPANPVNPQDVAAADAWNRVFNEWFPNAVIDGWVDLNFDGRKTADEIRPGFADKVDFMGVQYYGTQPMGGFGFAPLPGFNFLQGIPFRCEAAEQTCSDFNQPIDPGGFREVLEVAASYGKPLWITENGVADDDDTKRPGYIVNHIAVVQDLVAHGTDIRGYTYWSFVDNLEWADGYHLQFGLYGSDPSTPELERTPKPASISAISQITGANALPTGLLGLYLPGVTGIPA